MRSRCAWWGLVVALLLGAVAEARAATAPLRLDIDACVNVDTALVSRVVTLELGEMPADGEGSPIITKARADCQARSVLVIIEDPVTGKQSSRTSIWRVRTEKFARVFWAWPFPKRSFRAGSRWR